MVYHISFYVFHVATVVQLVTRIVLTLVRAQIASIGKGTAEIIVQIALIIYVHPLQVSLKEE